MTFPKFPVVRRLSRFALIGALAAFSPLSFSALESLNDDELGEMTGQAFVSMETYESAPSSDQNLQFTRVNLGLKAEALLNIDKLELGKYERTGEVAGSSDIEIDNFALGAIENGEIVPFEIDSPYLDFAYDGTDLVGFRLGFGGARGILSGDIKSLTGKINVKLEDDNAFGLGARVDSNAELVSNNGSRDSVRSTKIGLANGQVVLATVFGIDTTLTVNDCSTSLTNTNTCFDLSTYRSLPIAGTFNEDHTFNPNSQMAEGIFLGFQSETVDWRESPDVDQYVKALSGAFMNIPSGLQVNLEEAEEGFKRVLTCFNGAETC
ncbi:hypothetical protein [Parendozoicomonas haliclonae]|uniref:Uncharacterized protein n=1 Tax=Parendozoicomonas haliclonae TaxID=1960125 RepID=A0A1X7AI89_9GAMM|nr:hypothetical protein [Parendozoicomonas haliclonae]SMA43525.1 hypothetical protein EHSB41UT_01614 [Parendozoicomonas haliclonae]